MKDLNWTFEAHTLVDGLYDDGYSEEDIDRLVVALVEHRTRRPGCTNESLWTRATKAICDRFRKVLKEAA